jgi:hypothetical protein
MGGHFFDVAMNQIEGLSVVINENSMRRPSAEGLDTHGAGAGKKV